MDVSRERKKHISLKIKTFRVILLVSLILIIVGSASGLLLYAYTSLSNYKDESRHLIEYTMSMQDSRYIEKIFRETRDIYESMPEEVRNDPASDEFISAVAPLIDDDYYKAREILVKCRERTEQRNMFLMFTDPENSAIVYVVDGDEVDWAYIPGQWQQEDLAKIESVQDSSWKLIITHEDEYGWIGTDCEKIYNKSGDVIGYAVMDLDINDFLHHIFGFLAILLPIMVLIAVGLALLSGSLLRKHIISHLTSMADAAREYTAMDKVDMDEQTRSVFEPLGINTYDELEDLWHSMSGMERDIKDSIIRLREITTEQERIGAELEIATKIQMGTLPQKYPERDEFELYAYMKPAKEVGGDLYDFFMIDDDHLALVIADVAGKGVSAALFMVIAKTLIKNQSEQSLQDPAEIMNKVNLKLIEINTTHNFVTTWLGILDIRSGEVKYVNAGHEQPAIRRKGSSFEFEEGLHDVPLAASRRAKYSSGSFMLYPGDTVFQYSDGVTEANAELTDLFGEKRLLEALNSEPDADPETIVGNVNASIADFVKDAPQFDDTTMLCLKYNGSGSDKED